MTEDDDAKLFELTLNEREAMILRSVPKLSGGHASHYASLCFVLDTGHYTFTFTDAQLGKLVRYMSYGNGGYQETLRLAFRRVLTDKLQIRPKITMKRIAR